MSLSVPDRDMTPSNARAKDDGTGKPIATKTNTGIFSLLLSLPEACHPLVLSHLTLPQVLTMRLVSKRFRDHTFDEAHCLWMDTGRLSKISLCGIPGMTDSTKSNVSPERLQRLLEKFTKLRSLRVAGIQVRVPIGSSSVEPTGETTNTTAGGQTLTQTQTHLDVLREMAPSNLEELELVNVHEVGVPAAAMASPANNSTTRTTSNMSHAEFVASLVRDESEQRLRMAALRAENSEQRRRVQQGLEPRDGNHVPAAAGTSSTHSTARKLRFENLTKLSVSGALLRRDNAFVRSLLHSSDKLVSVSLGGCRRLTDEDVRHTIMNPLVGTLTSLTLKDCTSLERPAISSPILKSLSLERCARVRALGADDTNGDGCPMLERLDLSFCSDFGRASQRDSIFCENSCGEYIVPGLKAGLFPGLKALSLRGCLRLVWVRVFSGKGPKLALAVAEQQLTTLDLRMCAALQRVSISCPTLQRVNVGMCTSLRSVAMNVPRMQVLNLSMLPVSCVELTNCQSMRELNLAGCCCLQDAGLRLHSGCVTRSAMQVDICGTKMTDEYIESLTDGNGDRSRRGDEEDGVGSRKKRRMVVTSSDGRPPFVWHN